MKLDKLINPISMVIRAKARQFMSTKIKYTDERVGKVKVVQDFLPTPEELAFREDGVKVTNAQDNIPSHTLRKIADELDHD